MSFNAEQYWDGVAFGLALLTVGVVAYYAYVLLLIIYLAIINKYKARKDWKKWKKDHPNWVDPRKVKK